MATNAQPPPPPSSTAAILSRLVRPEDDALTPEAAEGWLRIKFEQRDLDRMHELAVKNQDGAIAPNERIEMENYRNVAFLLDLMHSKARLALGKRGPAQSTAPPRRAHAPRPRRALKKPRPVQ